MEKLFGDLATQAPGVAFGLVILFFYTELVKSYLAERKELIATIIAERKQWNDTLKELNQEYAALLIRTIEHIGAAKAEDHSLRNTINALLIRIETWMLGGKKPSGTNRQSG